MWIVVMFDLPVVEKAERKAATDFRKRPTDTPVPARNFMLAV